MTEREDAILDAAVRLILTKGYEAMSINDVCKATGLTKGAVFH
jgi:TetR/AcrR family transcriptional regulator, transcriptional repressor for nem operon